MIASAGGAFVAAMVLVLMSVTGSRLPGQTLTGSSVATTARVVSLDLGRARTLEAAGQDLAALKLYQAALRVVPRQPEALAYQGWILRQTGEADHSKALVDEGTVSIKAALTVDPRYADAHAFLGYVLWQDDHDAAGAVAQFRSFLADHPAAQMVSLTRSVVAQAFAAAGRPVPSPSSPAAP